MDFDPKELVRTVDGIIGPEKFTAVLRPAMDDALSVIESHIVELTPDGATGNLRRSITHAVVITPGLVTGSVFVQPDSDAALYAPVVEYGRTSKVMPPWGEGTPLYKWVTRKITSAHYKTTGKVLRKTPSRDKQILSASFLIARAIAKNGTKPQKFFETGFNNAQPEVDRIINQAIDVALA